jgi:hypothetical protein
MEDQVTLLREMLVWIRAGNFSAVEQMLVKALPDPRHRLAYQAMDGLHTVEGVKKAAAMGSKALTALTDRCVAMGLMERVNGKPRRLFDLTNFGLVVEATGGGAGDE